MIEEITGVVSLEATEARMYRGILFNSGTCCASGTCEIGFLPTEDRLHVPDFQMTGLDMFFSDSLMTA